MKRTHTRNGPQKNKKKEKLKKQKKMKITNTRNRPQKNKKKRKNLRKRKGNKVNTHKIWTAKE